MGFHDTSILMCLITGTICITLKASGTGKFTNKAVFCVTVVSTSSTSSKSRDHENTFTSASEHSGCCDKGRPHDNHFLASILFQLPNAHIPKLLRVRLCLIRHTINLERLLCKGIDEIVLASQPPSSSCRLPSEQTSVKQSSQRRYIQTNGFFLPELRVSALFQY